MQQEKELTENILKVVRLFSPSYFCLNLHVNMNGQEINNCIAVLLDSVHLYLPLLVFATVPLCAFWAVLSLHCM